MRVVFHLEPAGRGLTENRAAIPVLERMVGGMARATNQEFSRTDMVFKMACELANIEPTTRQASKFRNCKGTAIKYQGRAAKAVTKKQE